MLLDLCGDGTETTDDPIDSQNKLISLRMYKHSMKAVTPYPHHGPAREGKKQSHSMMKTCLKYLEYNCPHL